MTRNARIVLVTWDGAGNLPPELALADALVARGHSVHALAHDSLREGLGRHGIEALELRGAHPYDSKIPMAPQDEMPFVVEHVWFAEAFGSGLLEAVERLRPDALLVDVNLAYALVAARRTGLPTVALCHFPYAFLVGAFSALLEPRLPSLNDYGRQLGLAPFPSYRALIESASRVAVTSYRGFDPLEEAAENVVHVGPCRGGNRTATAWPRRAPDRPLVVVGMSTSHQHQVPLLQRLCDVLGSLDVEALVTTGPAIDPEMLRPSGATTVARFVSHDAVLPSADLLITHAGHGTVMAGASHGVPMLCLPMGRDQPLIAGRVAELGLGAVLAPDASHADVGRAITAMLGDRVLADRVDGFSRSVLGHPGLDHAVGLVEGLLDPSPTLASPLRTAV